MKVGRLTFEDPETFDRSGRQATVTSVEGPATRADVAALRQAILSMVGRTVPVLWGDDPSQDGWWKVEDAAAQPVVTSRDATVVRWSMQLVRVGSESEVQFESRLFGADVQNGHGISGVRWHAPPQGHYGYHVGSDEPTVLTRTGAAGDLTVYRGLPAVNPLWGVAPENFYAAAATITDDGRTVAGEDVPLDPTGWQINNDLVRVTPNVTNPGRFDVASFDGTDWRTVEVGLIRRSTHLVDAWQVATVLRNDPAEVVIRLSGEEDPQVGKITVDLALRRGSRTVRGLFKIHRQNTLRVRAIGETSTVDQGGYVKRDTTDGNGNRWLLGSARSFTVQTVVNAGIERAATTFIDWFAGHIVDHDARTSGDGDHGDDLAAQHVGRRSIIDRTVRR